MKYGAIYCNIDEFGFESLDDFLSPIIIKKYFFFYFYSFLNEDYVGLYTK